MIRALDRERYIERDLAEKGSRQPWYRITETGRELIRASAAERLRRTTAQVALAEFIERLKQVNRDARYLCAVRKAVVFGSFLSDKERLGDVDVAVDIASRIPLQGNWAEQFLKHARESGRYFGTFDAELDWPRREVLLALKARKRTISIHSWYSFTYMDKTPGFRYQVLLGDEREIRRDLNQAEREKRED